MLSKEIGGKEITRYDEEDKQSCPQCGAKSVVPLTRLQLAKQPDDTTHVCHPMLGGCNQGYASA